MKIVIPAIAAAFIATVGAGSAAQAAVIDFSVAALCPMTCTGITYAGSNLGLSTAYDLDGSTWLVTRINTGDMSGLSAGDFLTSILPTSLTYGAVSGSGLSIPVDIVKMWTGAAGSFTETLTSLDVVTRGINTIAFDFSGTVTGGVFHSVPATMDLSLTQAGGPGNVVSASLTNQAAIPEPATWVMLALGFIGLGYAAVRRSAKDKAAMAV